MELIERLTADVATIKGALCILKSTVPIARNPTRVIDVTATFKQKKIDIVKEGFDPSRVPDPIYFNHPQEKAFVRLGTGLYRDINGGTIRL